MNGQIDDADMETIRTYKACSILWIVTIIGVSIALIGVITSYFPLFITFSGIGEFFIFM